VSGPSARVGVSVNSYGLVLLVAIGVPFASSVTDFTPKSSLATTTGSISVPTWIRSPSSGSTIETVGAASLVAAGTLNGAGAAASAGAVSHVPVIAPLTKSPDAEA